MKVVLQIPYGRLVRVFRCMYNKNGGKILSILMAISLTAKILLSQTVWFIGSNYRFQSFKCNFLSTLHNIAVIVSATIKIHKLASKLRMKQKSKYRANIDTITMHTSTFKEFLWAINENSLCKEIVVFTRLFHTSFREEFRHRRAAVSLSSRQIK